MLAEAKLLPHVAAFIDDLCNGGKNHPANLDSLECLFAALARKNFKIGARKIEVGASHLLAFGYKLENGTWAPDPARVDPIARLVPPVNRS